MNSFRADFYKSLRTDYNLDGKSSILYGYLKAEKERLSGEPEYAPAHSGSRKDSYVTLHRAFCSYKDGAIDECEYLLCFLKVLKRDGRLRLDSDEHDTLEKWLDEMVHLAGKDIAGGKRSKKEVYENLAEILQWGQGDAIALRRVICREGLESLTYGLLEKILHEDAKRLLYDASRKKEKSLDLIGYYFRKRHIAPLSGNGTGGVEFLGEEKMQMVQTLFDLLKNEKRFDWVFLPVAIDGSTGAGIYITGKQYFSEVDSIYSQFKKGEHCCFSLLYYSELIVDDGSISYSCDVESLCGAPGLKEVKKWYEMARDNGSLYDAYRGNNGMPPKGCPQPLLKYFEEADAWNDGITDEEIIKTKAELDTEFEKIKKENKLLKRGGDPRQHHLG